ncbi:hypothetical protein FOA52_000360 [Chlamydomonas sp. UWO 241]|nr:hypothetical protein FOA52_000360 [Chlamydomonas sp. UWO 241]
MASLAGGTRGVAALLAIVVMMLEGAVSQSICPGNDFACEDCFFKSVKYRTEYPGLQGRCETCTLGTPTGDQCIACLNLDNAKYPIANVHACLQCVVVAPFQQYGCSQFCLNTDLVRSEAEAQDCSLCVQDALPSNVLGCSYCMGSAASGIVNGDRRIECFACIANGRQDWGCALCATFTDAAGRAACYACVSSVNLTVQRAQLQECISAIWQPKPPPRPPPPSPPSPPPPPPPSLWQPRSGSGAGHHQPRRLHVPARQ